MKLIFSDRQAGHRPRQFMMNGRIVDPFESPARVAALIQGLSTLGLERSEPTDYGHKPIMKVHAYH